jgi:hypothetical protein
MVMFAVGLLLISTSLAACVGFDVGDVVRVRTPGSIQQQTGLPSSTTLNEAQSEYQAWLADVQRAGAQWRNSIERGNEVRALMNQLTLSALDEVGPTIAGLPVLGPVLPAATGLLGLFLGVSRMRKEKEDSYNAGLGKGQQLTQPSSTPAPPLTPDQLNT